MTFIRKEEKKGLSLPGLIDIIFLLLVFNLATLSFSNLSIDNQEMGKGDSSFQLPEAKVSNTYEASAILENLLFQVEEPDSGEGAGRKWVYILLPGEEDSLTLASARRQSIADSMFAPFPYNFLDLNDGAFAQTPPCTLIHWALREYKNQYFQEPRFSNIVEIRADQNTEFRIINFIIEECSAYGDTIPRFMLRTYTGTEVESGI